MKYWPLIFCLFCSLQSVSQDYPEAVIANGSLEAHIYLPQGSQGYYQGTRFDQAGVISSLKFKGHEFFGVWNPIFKEGLHDAITGPVEEFMEMGYDEARVGETFIRIGVGALKKLDIEPQSRFRTYEIADAGKRKVKVKKDRITFTQVLTSESGYGYAYVKELRLIQNEPRLVIHHSLKNTGKRTIETSVYNHNFFMIDGEPTGPNIKTTFAFTPQGKGKGFGTVADFEGKSLIYKRELKAGENLFSDNVTGFSDSSDDFNILIENLKTGAGVEIRGTEPIDKMIYWSCPTTACPEPYNKLVVHPGMKKEWDIMYDFKSAN